MSEELYGDLVDRIADRHQIPRGILRRKAARESSWDPGAVGAAGELGLLQVKPETAEEVGISRKLLDKPEWQIEAGARYAAKQHKRFGDWRKAEAAYNWGPKNVAGAPSEDAWPETVRSYVNETTGAKEKAQLQMQAQAQQQEQQAEEELLEPEVIPAGYKEGGYRIEGLTNTFLQSVSGFFGETAARIIERWGDMETNPSLQALAQTRLGAREALALVSGNKTGGVLGGLKAGASEFLKYVDEEADKRGGNTPIEVGWDYVMAFLDAVDVLWDPLHAPEEARIQPGGYEFTPEAGAKVEVAEEIRAEHKNRLLPDVLGGMALDIRVPLADPDDRVARLYQGLGHLGGMLFQMGLIGRFLPRNWGMLREALSWGFYEELNTREFMSGAVFGAALGALHATPYAFGKPYKLDVALEGGGIGTLRGFTTGKELEALVKKLGVETTTKRGYMGVLSRALDFDPMKATRAYGLVKKGVMPVEMAWFGVDAARQPGSDWQDVLTAMGYIPLLRGWGRVKTSNRVHRVKGYIKKAMTGEPLGRNEAAEMRQLEKDLQLAAKEPRRVAFERVDENGTLIVRDSRGRERAFDWRRDGLDEGDAIRAFEAMRGEAPKTNVDQLRLAELRGSAPRGFTQFAERVLAETQGNVDGDFMFRVYDAAKLAVDELGQIEIAGEYDPVRLREELGLATINLYGGQARRFGEHGQIGGARGYSKAEDFTEELMHRAWFTLMTDSERAAIERAYRRDVEQGKRKEFTEEGLYEYAAKMLRDYALFDRMKTEGIGHVYRGFDRARDFFWSYIGRLLKDHRLGMSVPKEIKDTYYRLRETQGKRLGAQTIMRGFMERGQSVPDGVLQRFKLQAEEAGWLPEEISRITSDVVRWNESNEMPAWATAADQPRLAPAEKDFDAVHPSYRRLDEFHSSAVEAAEKIQGKGGKQIPLIKWEQAINSIPGAATDAALMGWKEKFGHRETLSKNEVLEFLKDRAIVFREEVFGDLPGEIRAEYMRRIAEVWSLYHPLRDELAQVMPQEMKHAETGQPWGVDMFLSSLMSSGQGLPRSFFGVPDHMEPKIQELSGAVMRVMEMEQAHVTDKMEPGMMGRMGFTLLTTPGEIDNYRQYLILLPKQEVSQEAIERLQAEHGRLRKELGIDPATEDLVSPFSLSKFDVDKLFAYYDAQLFGMDPGKHREGPFRQPVHHPGYSDQAMHARVTTRPFRESGLYLNEEVQSDIQMFGDRHGYQSPFELEWFMKKEANKWVAIQAAAAESGDGKMVELAKERFELIADRRNQVAAKLAALNSAQLRQWEERLLPRQLPWKNTAQMMRMGIIRTLRDAIEKGYEWYGWPSWKEHWRRYGQDPNPTPITQVSALMARSMHPWEENPSLAGHVDRFFKLTEKEFPPALKKAMQSLGLEFNPKNDIENVTLPGGHEIRVVRLGKVAADKLPPSVHYSMRPAVRVRKGEENIRLYTHGRMLAVEGDKLKISDNPVSPKPGSRHAGLIQSLDKDERGRAEYGFMDPQGQWYSWSEALQAAPANTHFSARKLKNSHVYWPDLLGEIQFSERITEALDSFWNVKGRQREEKFQAKALLKVLTKQAKKQAQEIGFTDWLEERSQDQATKGNVTRREVSAWLAANQPQFVVYDSRKGASVAEGNYTRNTRHFQEKLAAGRVGMTSLIREAFKEDRKLVRRYGKREAAGERLSREETTDYLRRQSRILQQKSIVSETKMLTDLVSSFGTDYSFESLRNSMYLLNRVDDLRTSILARVNAQAPELLPAYRDYLFNATMATMYARAVKSSSSTGLTKYWRHWVAESPQGLRRGEEFAPGYRFVIVANRRKDLDVSMVERKAELAEYARFLKDQIDEALFGDVRAAAEELLQPHKFTDTEYRKKIEGFEKQLENAVRASKLLELAEMERNLEDGVELRDTGYYRNRLIEEFPAFENLTYSETKSDPDIRTGEHLRALIDSMPADALKEMIVKRAKGTPKITTFFEHSHVRTTTAGQAQPGYDAIYHFRTTDVQLPDGRKFLFVQEIQGDMQKAASNLSVGNVVLSPNFHELFKGRVSRVGHDLNRIRDLGEEVLLRAKKPRDYYENDELHRKLFVGSYAEFLRKADPAGASARVGQAHDLASPGSDGKAKPEFYEFVKQAKAECRQAANNAKRFEAENRKLLSDKPEEYHLSPSKGEGWRGDNLVDPLPGASRFFETALRHTIRLAAQEGYDGILVGQAKTVTMAEGQAVWEKWKNAFNTMSPSEVYEASPTDRYGGIFSAYTKYYNKEAPKILRKTVEPWGGKVTEYSDVFEGARKSRPPKPPDKPLGVYIRGEPVPAWMVEFSPEIRRSAAQGKVYWSKRRMNDQALGNPAGVHAGRREPLPGDKVYLLDSEGRFAYRTPFVLEDLKESYGTLGQGDRKVGEFVDRVLSVRPETDHVIQYLARWMRRNPKVSPDRLHGFLARRITENPGDPKWAIAEALADIGRDPNLLAEGTGAMSLRKVAEIVGRSPSRVEGDVELVDALGRMLEMPQSEALDRYADASTLPQYSRRQLGEGRGMPDQARREEWKRHKEIIARLEGTGDLDRILSGDRKAFKALGKEERAAVRVHQRMQAYDFDPKDQSPTWAAGELTDPHPLTYRDDVPIVGWWTHRGEGGEGRTVKTDRIGQDAQGNLVTFRKEKGFIVGKHLLTREVRDGKTVWVEGPPRKLQRGDVWTFLNHRAMAGSRLGLRYLRDRLAGLDQYKNMTPEERDGVIRDLVKKYLGEGQMEDWENITPADYRYILSKAREEGLYAEAHGGVMDEVVLPGQGRVKIREHLMRALVNLKPMSLESQSKLARLLNRSSGTRDASRALVNLLRGGSKPIFDFESWSPQMRDLFYRPIRDAFGKAHRLYDAEMKWFDDQMRKYGIDHKRLQDIYIHAIWQQEYGAATLKTKHGIKQVPKLEKHEAQFLDALRTRLREMVERVRSVQKEMGFDEEDMVFIRPQYFTFMRDIASSVQTGQENFSSFRFGTAVEASDPYHYTRVPSVEPFQLNLPTAWSTYMRYAWRYMMVSPHLQTLSAHMSYDPKGPDGKPLRIGMGDVDPVGKKWLKDWMDGVAGRPPASMLDRNTAGIWRMIEALNTRVGGSILSLNFRSGVVQLSALRSVWWKVGTRDFMEGLAAWATHPTQRREIRDISQVLGPRLVGAGEEYIMDMARRAEHALRSGGVWKHPFRALDVAAYKGLYLLRKMDAVTASAAAFVLHHHFSKRLRDPKQRESMVNYLRWRDGKHYEGAELEAVMKEEVRGLMDDYITKTQATMTPDNRAPWQRHPLGRVMLKFQNFVLNDFNFFVREVLQTEGRTPIQNMNSLLRYAAVTAIIAAMYEELPEVLGGVPWWLGGTDEAPGLQAPFGRPIAATRHKYEESGSAKSAALKGVGELLEPVPIFSGPARWGTGIAGPLAEAVAEPFRWLADVPGPKDSPLTAVAVLAGVPGASQFRKSLRAYKKRAGKKVSLGDGWGGYSNYSSY